MTPFLASICPQVETPFVGRKAGLKPFVLANSFKKSVVGRLGAREAVSLMWSAICLMSTIICRYVCL